MRKIGVLLLLLILAGTAAGEAIPALFNDSHNSCPVDEDICSVGEAINLSIKSPDILEGHDEDLICIVYFYGIGCSKCAETTPVVDEIQEEYCDEVKVHYIELYHNTSNYDLYVNFMTQKGVPEDKWGIPVAAIGSKYYMGVKQIEENLENDVIAGDPYSSVCPITGEVGCDFDYHPLDVSPSKKKEVSLTVIITAALVDSINPCAFAVLIFLIAFLSRVSSTRARVLRVGLTYIIAVYITYFLAGIGLLSAVQYIGVTGIFMKLAAVLAILFGLVNIKDYFFYGVGFTLKIPESQKARIDRWIHRANVPGALILGVMVAMFELPCTGGVYLAILAMLADSATQSTAVLYLLIYNLFFVLPLAVILGLVLFGMNTVQLEKWRTGGRKWMKLAMGLLLLALGVMMLTGWGM